MNRLLIIFTAIIFIAACNRSEYPSESTLGSYDEKAFMEEQVEADYEDQGMQGAREPEAEKVNKIIRTGNLNLDVIGLVNAKSQVDSLVRSTDAYYENESYNDYGNRLTFYLQIRIPEAKFNTFVSGLEDGIGTLVSKNLQARDVSEEYVDLEIRLENKLAYLAQYQSILKQAKTIKEILTVQEKIRGLEEEIESKKGRMKYLNDQVSYATLTVEISELVSKRLADQPRFITKILNAGKDGFSSLQSLLLGLISIWPYIMIASILFLFRKRIVRFFRRAQ